MLNILKPYVPSIARGLAGLCTALVLSAGALAQTSAPKPDETFGSVPIAGTDMILGRADAPVTIVEYASLTCSHCARFHDQVLPKVKETYIETGKARLVYRDFPLDRLALAGSMLARCAGPERYFGFIDILFREQSNWSQSRQPMRALGRLARLGGMSQAGFDACLRDESVQRLVLDQRLAGARAYKIDSTPTLIIGGRRYDRGLSFAEMRAVIEPILSGD